MKNQLRLQFYDITKDITRWLVTDLQKDNVWGGITKIHDIKDEPISFNNNRYSVYKLYSTNFCPIEQMPIVIDTLSIGLAQLKPDVKTIEKLVRYTSKKIIIPVDKITSSNNHQLVGNFILTDSLAHKEIHVNEPVTYELTIQGEGLTFPLHAPELVLPGISATLIGIEHADTISESRYFSQKTFTYSLNFERPGTYDVSKTINFTTFNPSTHKAHPLTVNTIFNVSESKNSTKARNAIDYLLHKDNLIALDISKSMQIEDYSPNRLAAVKKGISNFLKIQNQCDIGMIIFGGDAKPYSIETQGSYYDLERINSLEYSMVTDGTAIGDAIWIAGSNFNESPKKKKLVIIGDGDNTAGQISPGAALRLLQNNNIVIYTIGIGSSGPVPFGKDQEGKPFMVSNTFSDLDFKAIARATGGKYYWAKDAESLTRILKEIFAE